MPVYMRRAADCIEVRRLATLIDAIARRGWRGLPALMGKAPALTRSQMMEAVYYKPSAEIVKASGGIKGETADVRRTMDFVADYDPVLEAVTWDGIVNAVKWFKARHNREWLIYVGLIQGVETGRATWGTRAPADVLAERYELTTAAVYDTARQVPRAIARAASMGCAELEKSL